MTVRQLYYALVSAGAIPKTEQAYKRVCYHILQMRRRGVLPYAWVADNTRWVRKPNTYESLAAFFEINRDAYRRALWLNQSNYVEVWCEKDALAGVIDGVTRSWDVRLMVTRGFPSETFVYEASECIRAQSKPAYVYYFGDFDPSGLAIDQDLQKRLTDFGAVFSFERVAVLDWQIDEWKLPTRPTKKTDSRAKDWRGASVELDAIPVNLLRQLVEDCIKQHINEWEYQQTLMIEMAEKDTLDKVVANLGLDRS
jgi:hypothetical protein